MEKVNYPENSLFYINQTFLTSPKMFYGDHFILGHVIEAANDPADIDNHKYGPEEVKIYQPQYDPRTKHRQTLGGLQNRWSHYCRS